MVSIETPLVVFRISANIPISLASAKRAANNLSLSNSANEIVSSVNCWE